MSALRSICVLASILLAAAAVVGQSPRAANPGNNDAAAQQPLAAFAGHSTGITALAFVGADGNEIVSASAQGVRTHDIASGGERVLWEQPLGSVAAFNADATRLANVTRERLTIYDLQSGKEVLGFDPIGNWNRSFSFRPMVASMAFSPDGRLIATGGSRDKVGGSHGLPGGVVKIWNAKTGQMAHSFDQLSTGVCAVVFSSDGTSIAAGTNGAGGELPDSGEVGVWNAGNGNLVRSFKTKDRVDYGEFSSAADVAFSPDGKWVAVAVTSGGRGRPAGLIIDESASTIRCIELATGRDVLKLTGHVSGIRRLAFSPDGKLVAASGGDRAVRIWNTADGKLVKSLPFAVQQIDALAFSPDSRRLAAGASDVRQPGKIMVWSLKQN